MTGPASTGPRRGPLYLIAALFLVPLAAAVWLYHSGAALQPAGRTNHGALLEPIVNLNDAPGAVPLGELTGGASDGHWVMLYAGTGRCGDDCEDALYRLRQTRLMLGDDMSRVVRVFLHGRHGPDKVTLDQHPGLITITDRALTELLEAKRPADLAAGGLYLVDPLGNLVLYFSPGVPPGDLVEDVEHLLELSRIG